MYDLLIVKPIVGIIHVVANHDSLSVMEYARMANSKSLRVFCSYSHKDARLRAELENHVSPLKHQGMIETWDDREITAGSEWELQISKHLEDAHIILLLVSANFLASRYCHDIEMRRALERHDEGSARVVPIILRSVDLQGSPFNHLQALPRDRKPVTRWNDRDAAWTNVAQELRRMIDEIIANRSHVTSAADKEILPAIPSVAVVPISLRECPWLNGIDGTSLPKLIVSNASLIRVVAGPGSGKTTGLKRRVQRLIKQDAVLPSRIFVGTFTRAIARDLQSALGVDVSFREIPSDVGSVWVSTLHSLAYQILHQYPEACSGRLFRFLMRFEEDAMLYDIGHLSLEGSDQKGRRQQLDRMFAEWADGGDLEGSQFIGEIERWLRRHGGMLTGELINLAKRGLETGDIPSGIFDHVIIDEYQDLTRSEQILVELLWSKRGSFVVLGDNDQSIYSFRHNYPQGLTEFGKQSTTRQFEDIQMRENRRSQESIIRLANQIMAQGGPTKPPMLPSRPSTLSQLDLVVWPNLEAEIDGLAQYVRSRIKESFLILVPRRFIGYRLQGKIGVNALTSFHQEVLETSLVQERFTAASLLANPNDRVALRAWFGFKGRTAENAPKRNAPAYCSLNRSGLNMQEFVESIANKHVIPAGDGATHIYLRACQLIELWRRKDASVEDIVSFLFDSTLADTIVSPENRLKTQEDLDLLLNSALEIVRDFESENLAAVLARLRFRIATRSPLTAESHARVQIMTLHGAKGLEANNVIIAGLSDQAVPGPLKDDPFRNEEHREEQRRLLYVSITRARDSLIVSWPKQMKYNDAISNWIRTNQMVRGVGSNRVVQLSASSLLPLAKSPVNGIQWLEDILGNS